MTPVTLKEHDQDKAKPLSDKKQEEPALYQPVAGMSQEEKERLAKHRING